MNPGNQRAIYAALMANSGIAILKFVGWFFTGAASLLAEAVHSVADTSNQGLLLWGNAAAKRAPTPAHAFGYGRERYFWAFVVAMVIFSLGGLFALYEGTAKILHPHELQDPAWAIGILLIGIVFETLSLRTAIKAARQTMTQPNWWVYIRRTKNPELPVILLEDLGALLGLLLALTGISLAIWTGDSRFDALGSVSIGLLLVVIAFLLAVEMKSLLIGESAAPGNENLIEASAVGHPAVRRLIHLRTQHIGPDQLLIGAKIEFDSDLSLEALTQVIDDVETAIRVALPFSAIIYIEPAILSASNEPAPSEEPPPPS
ncbi:MAG: cation diffusion facilitator family transporter [Myxococcota bacterium]|nr:cation diffusion facilitator family transporter [Myxococcota bacterium]